MQNIIIKSDNITLRHTQIDDLEFVLKAEREPENALYVGQWSKDQHINSLSNSDLLHLIVEDSITKRPVGYIIMAGIKNPNHNIEFRRLVISEKGNGFGRESLKLTKELAFTKLKAHRLWLDVRYKNHRAQNLYKSEHFKKEGILRECILLNGSYESLIIMSILKDEYKNLTI